jgi:hypothetical protein
VVDGPKYAESTSGGEVVRGAPRSPVAAAVVVTAATFGVGLLAGGNLFGGEHRAALPVEAVAIGCVGNVTLTVGLEGLADGTYDLRASVGDRMLPMTNSMTYAMVGSSRGHQSVVPDEGRLLLVANVPAGADRTVRYEIVGVDGVVANGTVAPQDCPSDSTPDTADDARSGQELDVAGAEFVRVETVTTTNTDVALWADRNGSYLSLVASPASGMPPGARVLKKDEAFPVDAGEAWFDNRRDPRAAEMWWVRPSGDMWLLNAYWYGETMPDDPVAVLRSWALGMRDDGPGDAPYSVADEDLALVAFDRAGEKSSLARVWALDGHEVVLSVIEESDAAGRSNLLAGGAPHVSDVPGLGEVWQVGTTFGWADPDSNSAWATLTFPAALSADADRILRGVRWDR